MQIKVPYIQQRSDADCQVATTLMILEFYNDLLSYQEAAETLDQYKLDGGMHSQGHALFFLKRGYKVLFAHHDIDMLDPTVENCTEADVEKLETRLNILEPTEANSYQIDKLKLDIEFIKSGGTYSSQLPDFALIDRYLNEQIPVVLSGVRNKALHLRPANGRGNHSIIITGKNDDGYFVNDPSPNSPGQYQIGFNRLLHAWYNSGAHFRAVWR